jgi:hypothetical protein
MWGAVNGTLSMRENAFWAPVAAVIRMEQQDVALALAAHGTMNFCEDHEKDDKDWTNLSIPSFGLRQKTNVRKVVVEALARKKF